MPIDVQRPTARYPDEYSWLHGFTKIVAQAAFAFAHRHFFTALRSLAAVSIGQEWPPYQGAFVVDSQNGGSMPINSEPVSGGTDAGSGPISVAEFQALIEMVGEDTPEVVVDLLDTYLEESVELVRVIASAAHDRDTLLRPAHSLKSSSASIGAMNLSRLCADMEAYARGSMPDLDAAQHAIEIVQEFERVRVAVEHEKAELLNT